MSASPYRHECLVDRLPSYGIWKSRPLRRVDEILFHRNTVADTPTGIAQWYIDRKGWPSAPYHFDIDWLDGAPIVYQTARLRSIVYGAKRHNVSGIHIAFNADYRNRLPHPAMFAAGACLAADLLAWFAFERGQTKGKGSIRVRTHTEAALLIAPKRWLPIKQCPGKCFRADGFREVVSRALHETGHNMPVSTVGNPWWMI